MYALRALHPDRGFTLRPRVLYRTFRDHEVWSSSRETNGLGCSLVSLRRLRRIGIRFVPDDDVGRSGDEERSVHLSTLRSLRLLQRVEERRGGGAEAGDVVVTRCRVQAQRLIEGT